MKNIFKTTSNTALATANIKYYSSILFYQQKQLISNFEYDLTMTNYLMLK